MHILSWYKYPKLKEDLEYWKNYPTIRIVLFPFTLPYVLRFICSLRRQEYLLENSNKLVYRIAFCIGRYFFRRLSLRLGFTIPLGVFDGGLQIAHYGNIVIHPNCRIGKNCKIHTGVVIGAKNGAEDAPLIKDNVYIGAGSKIYGRLTIESGIRIAPNSCIVRDQLVKNSIVGGCPSKILSYGLQN